MTRAQNCGGIHDVSVSQSLLKRACGLHASERMDDGRLYVLAFLGRSPPFLWQGLKEDEVFEAALLAREAVGPAEFLAFRSGRGG